MSRTFSPNSGTVESLNVSARCGCQRERSQDAAHSTLAQARLLRERPSAPVRRVPRCALERLRDEAFHMRVGHRSRRAGACFIEETVHGPRRARRVMAVPSTRRRRSSRLNGQLD